jgi:hypothetical protein
MNKIVNFFPFFATYISSTTMQFFLKLEKMKKKSHLLIPSTFGNFITKGYVIILVVQILAKVMVGASCQTS